MMGRCKQHEFWKEEADATAALCEEEMKNKRVNRALCRNEISQGSLNPTSDISLIN